MTGVPYEIRPTAGFKAKGGQTTCFPIDFPSRAYLNRLAIVQVDGLPPVAFTAALYNAESACRGQNQSDSLSVGGPADILPPDLYRVTPDLVGTAGKLFYFSETQSGGHGFVFFNQDPASAPAAKLGNPRKIYLAITPAGAADNEFAVALGGSVFS